MSNIVISFRALSRNLPYFRQQFAASLNNTSTFIKIVCAVILLGYLLTSIEAVIDNFSVIPGYVVPPHFRIWTLLLFFSFELHFWEVLLDIITIGLCGKLLEPLWGQLEMLLFFLVTNIGVAITSVIFYDFVYMLTSDTSLIFDIKIHGLTGYIAGVSVAVRQIIPDNVIFKSPLGRITNRNIPLVSITISIISWLVGLVDGTCPVMFANGVFVSWVYLRFYQRHNNGIKGDLSDGFSFASFFPNVVQPPIAVLSTMIYNCLVRFGVCRKVVRKYDMANPSGVTVTLPGIDAHDMERRRQIALKALNERLSKVNSGDPKKSKPNSKIIQPIVQPRMEISKPVNFSPPQGSSATLGLNTAFATVQSPLLITTAGYTSTTSEPTTSTTVNITMPDTT